MKKWMAGLLALVAASTIGFMSVAYGETLKSNNFEIDESFVGGSGLVQSGSANYKIDSSLSDTAVGNTNSTNYQIAPGYTTTGDPALSFAVTSGNANFGSFSLTAATTSTSTFQVSNYTSYGYVVQIIGNPPSSGGHTLAGMSTTGPSQAGVEQFGINLVANTSPVSLGANPDHGQFGFGSAATGYDTANNYRYVSGETIATAPKSSGLTTYTISYIINVNTHTPAGIYSGNQVLVCTGTY